MKTRNAAVVLALALVAVQSFAQTHTVKFRRLNGTVFHQVEVEHGGSVSLPAPPTETYFRFKGWDHDDWLSCVTNDVNVYALYENDGSKTWSAGTSFGSKSIAEREEPYSLEEYFRMYDSVAWTDEFSRGSNTAIAVNSKYWNYDMDDRHKISLETAGGNQAESNGCLVLTIRREKAVRQGSYNTPSIEYDFTGGGIKSNNKVAFKHGRCEVRAKLTHNRGCGSSFWMLGNRGSWPACGELDIFEQPSGGDWITANFHIPGRGNASSISNGSPTSPEDGVHFGHGFHRYGTIINDREILWYMDDHIFKRMDVRDDRYSMVRDRPFYVILSYGLHTNNWVQAPDAPVDKYDLPELTDHVDFLIDYCRIYVNTNENNTLPHVPPVSGAKLSRPVNATVWRGWDMAYGRSGAGSFNNNINNGYDVRYYIKTALSEYLERDKIDVLAFLTEPDIKTDRNAAQFDIPGYTTMFMSANANAWNKDDNPKLSDGSYSMGRLQLFGDVMFDTRRFSVSESGVGLMKLSDDPAFTNCFAICADLREKATGARVKVIAANVTTTNGVGTAGGTVAQGFDTLFSKLNAMKDEHVVVMFQGMTQKLYNYIKAQADSRLQSPYSLVGSSSTTYSWHCSYATARVSATAARPAKIPVTKSNLTASYTQNPQALQTSVVFDELPAVDDGMSDTFNASDYAKSMEVTFSGYSGSALANFPVLVKLSMAIAGFNYSDFQLPNGGDLRFTDPSGNVLPHEIDTWNPSGVSTAWVKVPSLAPNAKIVAHYGCARPVRVDASQVWDDNYVGVWHLGESALPLRESSGKSREFAYQSGTGVGFAAGGVVGGAVDFPSDGHTNTLVALDHDNLDGFDKFTIEAWTKQSTHKDVGGILSKRETAVRESSYYFYDKDGKTMLKASTNGTASVECIYTIQPNLNQWNHQVYTFDAATASSNLKGYLNGAAYGTASKAFGRIFAGRGNLHLGNLCPDLADSSFNGQIDEVRISKVARSAAWIKATHDTVMNADFATYSFGDSPDPVDPQPECGSLATNDYAKAIDVTFSGAPSDATLTNFPVLVKLSTAIAGFSYADFRRPNGGDLRFADANGYLLTHEIDTWNSNGVSTVWVKVPQLTKDVAITAHYGYTGSGDPVDVDAKDVWDSNYLGVWHLGAAAGVSAQPDSTANGKGFGIHTNNSDGVASGADGVVGRSASTGLRTDGKGCFFQSDADKLFVNQTAFTVETWTWQDDHEPDQNPTLRYVLAHSGQNETSYDWRIYENNKGKLVMQFYSLGSLGESDAKIFADDGATRPARAQWNHTAFAWDGSSGQVGLYLGGSQLALAEAVTSKDWTGTMNGEKTGFNLGNHRYDNTKSFKGRIDEVRISKVARSAAWIKATHDTIANADFATYSTDAGTLSGYAAWVAEKGLTGTAAAFDNVSNGIKNGIRYAFDIDPSSSTVGDPIIKVVRDSSGNPVVEARELAAGRDDVTFGVLATENLTDWSNATLVPMKKFETDGFWKPSASESPTYVFPAKMFFKYKVEVK